MLSPRQIFEDNIRPADLLLKVFRLLEHNAPNTEVDLVKSLREIVKANDEEGMIVIYNENLLGLDPGASRGATQADSKECSLQLASTSGRHRLHGARNLSPFGYECPL